MISSAFHKSIDDIFSKSNILKLSSQKLFISNQLFFSIICSFQEEVSLYFQEIPESNIVIQVFQSLETSVFVQL